MKSSDLLVLVITGLSFVGAIFCYLRLFSKPATYLLKANYPLNHRPRQKAGGHFSKSPEDNILTPAEQELLLT